MVVCSGGTGIDGLGRRNVIHFAAFQVGEVIMRVLCGPQIPVQFGHNSVRIFRGGPVARFQELLYFHSRATRDGQVLLLGYWA